MVLRARQKRAVMLLRARLASRFARGRFAEAVEAASRPPIWYKMVLRRGNLRPHDLEPARKLTRLSLTRSSVSPSEVANLPLSLYPGLLT